MGNWAPGGRRQWTGRAVALARAHVARTQMPGPCGKCGHTVTTDDDWVVGHIKSRHAYPELTWHTDNWQPEHKKCSDKTGHDARAEREARKFGTPGPQATRVPLFSLSPDGPVDGAEVLPELVWAPESLSRCEWLQPFLEVPEDVATPPLAMTPQHPEVVGSYGPELIEWAKREMGLTLRWWQGLSLCRILEHRDDGSLCWEEVIISCSRRSGKSVIVRLLALWRMVFAAALFEEMQLIVHSASTLRVAKEPMRYASSWARGQGNLSVYTNNNNYAIEDHVDGHRWMVLPPDKVAGLDTNMGILDEAWACKPEVVDDDLEPSMMERVSPQLLLVSTAHRRATSLMRNRIEGALDGKDSDRTLLLLWAARAGDDAGDPAAWKAASPHWSPSRARYVERKYDKAVRGEVDPEFDDPDPLRGFESQYLNVWHLRKAPTVGEPVTTPEAWAELEAEAPGRVPDAVAVEDWFSEGVSVARAWRLPSGAAVVRVTGHADLVEAAAVVAGLGYERPVVVGASIAEDPAWEAAGVRTEERSGAVRSAVSDLARLLKGGALAHDGGERLAGQVLAVRTSPGVDGVRVRSTSPADAVKAAVWAAGEARTLPAPRSPLVVL